MRVADGVLRVRFGWGFRAEIPLTSVKDARPHNDKVYSWGAHRWRGRWLAPITLRTFYVSVTDPQALIAECAPN